jgi:hypothetical protein
VKHWEPVLNKILKTYCQISKTFDSIVICRPNFAFQGDQFPAGSIYNLADIQKAPAFMLFWLPVFDPEPGNRI